VSAPAGAGIETHKAERFGCGGIQDFPDVDIHALVNDFEFVDHGNVDGAEDVFGQFNGFGSARVFDAYCFLNDFFIQGKRQTDIAQTDDADQRRVPVYFLLSVVG